MRWFPKLVFSLVAVFGLSGCMTSNQAIMKLALEPIPADSNSYEVIEIVEVDSATGTSRRVFKKSRAASAEDMRTTAMGAIVAVKQAKEAAAAAATQAFWMGGYGYQQGSFGTFQGYRGGGVVSSTSRPAAVPTSSTATFTGYSKPTTVPRCSPPGC